MTGPRERHQRRLALAGGIAAAMFLVGAFVASTGRGDAGTDAADDRTAPHSASGPASTPDSIEQADGMEAGFTPDEEGAVDAAIAFATASQRWLYFTDAEIREAIEQIATPAAVERLNAGVVADVSAARQSLGEASGRVWWLVRPLAWDVEHHDGAEARVSVWVVTVLSAAGVAAPQAEWMTVTLDLAWVEGDWRVDAVRDAPGPTPITGPGDRPWDAVPFDEALSDYTRIDRHPVR